MEALTAHRLSPAARPGYHRGRRPASAGKTYPAEVLRPDEVTALLRACGERAVGLRNRALIAILYRAGLRIGEALALLEKDLDLPSGSVTVLHGKGDRRRVAGIDPWGGTIIQAWIEQRQLLGFDSTVPLFCTLSGRRLHASYVRTLLPRLARRAGIGKRVHAHGLRHTHASELAKEGVPMNVIQQQLGHASLATTDTYVRHLTPTELLTALQGRRWPDEPGFPSAS